MIYRGVNECVLSLVPSSADRILDIGCGSGVAGERLRRERERTIVGITYSQKEAELAATKLTQVICADLNTFDFSTLGEFDCVVLSHVLEHLHSPEQLLERLKCVLGPQSVVVVALPNVLCWRQRLEFLLGRWRYKDWGILDRTHLRFFDLHSSEELLELSGYEILKKKYDGPFPLSRLFRRFLGPLASKLDSLLCKLAPGLFSFQFVYLARVHSDFFANRGELQSVASSPTAVLR